MNNVSLNPAIYGLPVRLIEGETDEHVCVRKLADGEGLIRRCCQVSENALEGFCLDLSSFPDLGRKDQDLEKNNNTMSLVLRVFMRVALANGFHFSRIDLSNNKISGQSILQIDFKEIKGRITELSFNNTLISSRGFFYLKDLPALKKLSLDYCSKLDTIHRAESSPWPLLEELSIVGSQYRIGPVRMETIAQKFPGLRKLDCTQLIGVRGKQTKLLGVTDPVTLSTVIDPSVYSCGHIVGLETVVKTNKCYVNCKSRKLDRFQPNMTRFEKLNERWTVKLIDFKRRDLASNSFYHIACGNLFTKETLQEILEQEGSDQRLMRIAKDILCPGCEVNPQIEAFPFGLIKVFPELTPTDDLGEPSQANHTLLEESVYMKIDKSSLAIFDQRV
jgi:hypothetical protein